MEAVQHALVAAEKMCTSVMAVAATLHPYSVQRHSAGTHHPKDRERQLELRQLAAKEVEAELEARPDGAVVPPAALHLSEAAHALIYPLYATRPPPEGPLEDADMTDEDDTYDW